eukprot:scaffold138985_cov148-Phaeocystis_antarctica.AAC.1
MVRLVGAEDVLDVAPVLPPRRTIVAFLRGEERVVHAQHKLRISYCLVQVVRHRSEPFSSNLGVKCPYPTPDVEPDQVCKTVERRSHASSSRLIAYPRNSRAVRAALNPFVAVS